MTRLLPGDLAPTFAAERFGGGTLTLEEKLERGRVWLGFFRFASCPLCNLRLHELAEVWPSVDSDIQMIAVFHSPHESIERWLTDKRPPIDVVLDPEGVLYKLYGTEKRASAYVSATMPLRFVKATLIMKQAPWPTDGARTQVPADFLIERDGVIRDVFYGKNIADHIPFKRVEKFVERERRATDIVGAPVLV